MIDQLKGYLEAGDVTRDLKDRMFLAGFTLAIWGKGLAFFDTMVEYNQVEKGPTEYFKMLVSMDFHAGTVEIQLGYDDQVEPEYFETLPEGETDVVGWMKGFLKAQLQPEMVGNQKYFHEDVASYPEAFKALIVKAEALNKWLEASPAGVLNELGRKIRHAY